jgi:predicted dienelactone hydrolase
MQLLLFLLSISSFAQGACFHVGETQRNIHPQRSRNWRGAGIHELLTEIWYPIGCAVKVNGRELGPPDHPLFEGNPVAKNAVFASEPASFPLILLSNGTGGTAESLEWLGATLAPHGYIAAAVDHPGNNAMAPLKAAGFLLWWERSADLTDVLDALLLDPTIGSRIDKGRIGAIGFSLGGYTVIELAGARTDRQLFIDFCNSKRADATCAPPEMSKSNSDHAPRDADLSEEDRASIARSGVSYRDPRVKAVFAMAPALGEAFTKSGFIDVTIPVAIVAGDADVTVPIATNAIRYASLMPSAKLTILSGGVSHYTFTQTCLPGTAHTLPEVCTDHTGIDRDETHRHVASMAIAFFDQTL